MWVANAGDPWRWVFLLFPVAFWASTLRFVEPTHGVMNEAATTGRWGVGGSWVAIGWRCGDGRDARVVVGVVSKEKRE